ncbi:MAG: adenylate/guanylate cyclase domain-containing protein, partial [Methylotenera sp.]
MNNSNMTDRINIISICCMVFLDDFDNSKKPDSEQIVFENQINDLINIAFKYLAQNDRIILNIGDGVAIAYAGSPEDAMFMAMDFREEILNANTYSSASLYVRIGIHLEPEGVVNNINGQPNIIGDGINVAKRIMSFAKPNEVLVSRSYYENIPRSMQKISNLFDCSGVNHDEHVRDHEAYVVRLNQDQDQAAAAKHPLTVMDIPQSPESSGFLNKVSWKYAVPGLLILVALFALVQLTIAPPEPIISLAKSVAAEPEKVSVILTASAKPNKDVLMPNKTVENSPSEEFQSTNINELATTSNITLKEDDVNGEDDALTQEKALQEKLEQVDLVKVKLVKKEVKKEAKQITKNKAKKIAKNGTKKEAKQITKNKAKKIAK